MGVAIIWKPTGERKEVQGDSPRDIESQANEWGANRVLFWGEVWLKLMGEWVVL